MKRDRLASSRIRSLRIDRGMSPEQLGHVAGVSGHTIRRVERHGVIPTPRVQFLIATYFDLRPTQIWMLDGRVLAISA